MERIQIIWNRDWKFMYGDFPEAAEAGFDDGDWYDVCLPHSFGIPYFMENEFYVGCGCYRKELTVGAGWIGRKIGMEFQGVFQEARIYVNGRMAGEHRGGYTAFFVDITDYVQAGDNLIFVRVNNLWNPGLAPRAGEHVFNGGIYRDVSLLVTDPVHVAWYGTWVSTPEVSARRAQAEIRTEVENEGEAPVGCRLLSVFYHGEQEVTRVESELAVEAGGRLEAVQRTEISDPFLWSPETPELYRMESVLSVDGQVRDRFETSFGIRWFSFSAKEGFFLNGAHYEILGANVHQDHAGWADAVTHAGIERDVRMVKECGMNFIRGSHYPHHTYFAEECDRQGLLFWSENCFWGTGGPKEEGYWTASAYPVHWEDEEAFEESCCRSLREMIRTNRNHPSIIVWSMCNEPFFTDASTMEQAKRLVSRLVDLSHKLDPTRPAAVGGAQRGGFDVLGDLAGYNGDGAAIFRDPGFPNFVSEYGSTISDRPGEFGSRYTDGVEKAYPWRSGKALWCAFHHGSILDDMGHMGMIDYYRLPLQTWYWYREKLRGIPAPARAGEGAVSRLLLTADRTVISCDGTEDTQLVVSLWDEEGGRLRSDCKVTLRIISGDGLFPTGQTYVMSRERGNFADGMGAIELRARCGGEILIRAEAEECAADQDAGADAAERGVCDAVGTGAAAGRIHRAELRIRAVGENAQEGRRYRELPGPPFVTGAPKRDRLSEIGLNRPVFCSSEAEGFPAKSMLDAQPGTCWRPEAEDSAAWIMADLEGTKEIKEIRIAFEGMVQEAFEVSLSEDRKRFWAIFSSGERPALTHLTLNPQKARARYIRLRFPGRAAGVVGLEILQ